MRTSAALQYLYLQKPVSSIILICCIAVLPWLAIGKLSTEGETKEAAVAVSMLETGNWILPKVHTDELTYNPPLLHWMIAVFSLPEGKVSAFTARLPSAIAYTLMLVFVLILFGRKTRFQEAFIATLLLLTCFVVHQAALTAQVEMLLTTFMVIGLIQLFRWEDNLELKGLPVVIPLILSGAILTKGPLGIIFPLFVFGVYLLMLHKYNLLKIIKSLLYIGVASCFIPSLWYIEAWRQGGDKFMNMVFAGDFHPGEFILGHTAGAWHSLLTLLTGFMPWSLLLVFSLFGLKISKPNRPVKQWFVNVWTGILSLDKIKLFSLVASVCILFFYAISGINQRIFLISLFPFLALFMAQYFIYLAEYRSYTLRFFASILLAGVCIMMLMIIFQLTGIVDFNALIAGVVTNRSVLEQLQTVFESLSPGIVQVFSYFMLIISASVLCYQLRKKINIKILYASIFVVFCINLFINNLIR